MQLLIWHEALGSDDEQATEDELCARVLYAQGESELGGEAVLSGERLLQSLHLVQGLLAFVRMLRAKKSETYRTSANWTPEWASVTLSRRRFFVLEVEPRIFMTLAVHPAMEIKDHRAAYEALLQDLYGLFRLFHGTIDR
ncbi:hypothetical protein PHYBOEH_009744 [Phytophthora boehmeriae]|uniref:CCZ1/INTU/HSP4 first Longin domain-containing protein n=1 Tax=Phytophthora boehmeriae TaxID=109152 RepID=A0A8T1VRT3_9STRA|nr:hypothetical protein PHYBOEH_009744 [Phytophthora boehmeriae]